MPRSEDVPDGSSRSIIGKMDCACSDAFSDRAARAFAVSADVPALPRKPSFFPRALLAAKAAFVRAEIIPASSSATAIMLCSKKGAGVPLDSWKITKAYFDASLQDARQEALRPG